jgi:hypothetical protein
MKIVSERFKKIMGHWPVRDNFFNLDGNRLSFKHPDDDWQPAVSVRFTQNESKRAGLGLTGGQA